MIPKHIIEKAVNAAEDNWIVIAQWQHDKTWAQVSAALHAVAADIWDEGFIRGSHASETDASLHETREIDLNPYERIEHA